MDILSDEEFLKLHPWISEGSSGDTCLACMRMTAKAQAKATTEAIKKWGKEQ